MKEKIIKYSCLAILLALLLIPVIKQHTSVLNKEFEVEKLGGYFPPIDSAHFSIKNWWEGDFQKTKEANLKRDLKIGPYAVRVNNQMHYDILNEVRSKEIVEGEDGYLFEKAYIDDLLGLSFIGEEKIKDQVEKLKYIAEKLKDKNDIDIIVSIALSKAHFFKEKIPKQYDLSKIGKTNYEVYLKYFEKNDIHVLDFNRYFLEQKEKSEHALATKYGIHWSLYGGAIAADSMLKYIGKLKGKEVPEINKSQLEKTTISRNEDEDIGKTLNLYHKPKPETYSYFNNHIPPKDSIKGYRPNTILVGDSFCWTIWGNNIPHNFWGEKTLFMYYYNQIWDTKWDRFNGTKIKDVEIQSLVESTDAIILLYTPMNMNNFGSDFIDEMFEKLKKDNDN